MNKVKVAELKNNLSRYLAYVRTGREVLVLDRDTPVARLVPVSAAGGARRGTAERERWEEDRLGDLERQGLITRGSPRDVQEWLATKHPIRLPKGSGSVVEALLDWRNEDTR